MGGENLRYTLREEIFSDELMALYAEMDSKIAEFRRATGIECPSGCGKCCENPRLEATVLEFLPLAIRICDKKEDDMWLDVLSRASGGPCAFYVPDTLMPGNGKCGIYEYRGYICRLFGLFVRPTKAASPEIVACAVLKRSMPELMEKAREMVASGHDAPVASHFSMRFLAIDNLLSTRLLPVNAAIKEAIERVKCSRSYL
ncbi:MAG: YkgJ family cysteine cluster protein [Candidatus Omnitrophica bacterium]|nr:YkgJ family cysteine cluster protein [Candidatus Omnitrophota bacterium]MDD5487844.1 YkgJ family cysteine cluster protein [Candidatus Omnitrophota bacterium]